MDMNRQQSQVEVRSFIERQRADARAKAEAMQRDIIRRINEANQNVLQYMDDRAQMKLSRLADALNNFDSDGSELKNSLSAEQFLPAKRIIELRTKYASNMFDDRIHQDDHDEESHAEHTTTVQEPTEWEKSFFANGDKYRMYEELINLRAKWPFLAPALTSIYYAAEKDFSLDDIRTFLEYRHDKVLNLFHEHCKTTGKGKLRSACHWTSLSRFNARSSSSHCRRFLLLSIQIVCTDQSSARCQFWSLSARRDTSRWSSPPPSSSSPVSSGIGKYYEWINEIIKQLLFRPLHLALSFYHRYFYPPITCFYE